MSSIWLPVLVVSCAVSAWRIAGLINPGPAWRAAAAILLWWALMVLPFHLLGGLWLATSWPVVNVGAAAALAAFGALGILYATRVPETVPWQLIETGPLDRTAMGLAVGVQIALVGATLAVPPRGFDALWYHLPMAVRWMQTGGLGVGLGAAHAFYPGNGELLTMPLLTVARDSWAGLVQLPALLASGLFAALLARGRAALLLAAGVMTMPVSLEQASRAYVDLLVAAFLLGSVLFAERWWNGRRKEDLALASLSLGLALGTKYIAIVPVGILWLALLARVWAGRGTVRERFCELAILVAGTWPIWIWWMRNFALAGDPLRGSAAGIVIGTLLRGRLPASVVAPARLSAPLDLATSWWSAFGPLLILAVAGCAVVLLGRSPLPRPWRRPLPVVSAAIAGLVLLTLVPLTEPRFWIPVVICGAVVATRSSEASSPTSIRAVLSAAMVINVLMFGAVLTRARDFDHAWLRVDRGEFYGLPGEVDQLAEGSVVLVVGHPTLVYPATGARRQNRVLASPRGRLDREVQEWNVDYVLARVDETSLSKLDDQSWLVRRGERLLTRGSWWDTLESDGPQRSVLFEVRR